MKTTTTTIAALVAPLFFGAAAVAEGEKIDFQTLDANGDGVITADEAQAYPELMDAWATLDENADGALDEQEFANFQSDSDMSGSGQSEAGDSETGEQEGYTSEPEKQDTES